MLRWAVYETRKAHARSSTPTTPYYYAVADRKNTKSAALSKARKIIRQASHILAEFGDDALTIAWSLTASIRRRARTAGTIAAEITRWGPPRPAPADPLSAAARPSRASGLIRLSSRISQGGGAPNQSSFLPGAPKGFADPRKAGCSCSCLAATSALPEQKGQDLNH